eukprot:CAMPEP_0119072790 /NCGR_PEP_ID=MMETSP1178-20130426/59718_1 /TAXON_ID=33656 /ORGANISM="unid sp, Strain CCMP2000" /LENGTH=211 /DNA_ID=CAMNT_0007054827 /DNA_START=87 /DNA_END=722 /DNA_ORIENTATION=+
MTPQGLWLIPILALPHVLYLWLWTRSSTWIAMTGMVTRLLGGKWPADKAYQGDQACRYMASIAHVIKATQAASVIAWFSVYSPDALTPSGALSQPVWRLVLGATGLLLGQGLNVSIYTAIGRNGVYYGSRFGAPLGPWCTSFPFNIPVVGRHPQYTGVLLSLWGGVLLTCDDAATAAGFPQLAILWSMFYVFTGLVEQTEGKDRVATKAHK